jgi:hypothetical protein
MDLSDGLSVDLAEMCRQSGLGARVETRSVPVSPAVASLERARGGDALGVALHGGEDYELLLAVAPADFPALEELARVWSVEVAAIGEFFEGDPEVRLRIEVADSDSLFARPYVPAPDGEQAAGWVVESPELASRLETVRDRTLHIARTQLDSLARLQAGIVLAPAPELGRGRVAGAEFREMTPELAEYFHGQEEGLLVLRVIPGTPAGRLGLRGGDIVVEVNGRPVRSDMDFRREIVAAPEESVRVKWIRKGSADEGVLGPN